MGFLVQWIRSIAFVILFTLWTLVPPILFVWALLLPPRYCHAIVRGWQWMATALAWHVAGIRYRVIGWENVPQGACLIASKHQSAWETCLLHVLFRDPAIVLKKELTNLPIWGWWARATQLIPIDRKGGAKSLAIMQKASARAVKDGRKIVIFPQGTRVRPGVKKPYKVGIVAMYQELDLPVVPMALNSGLFWPKGQFLKKPGCITVEFLPAIPPGLTRTEMMRRLQDSIETASDRLAGIAN